LHERPSDLHTQFGWNRFLQKKPRQTTLRCEARWPESFRRTPAESTNGQVQQGADASFGYSGRFSSIMSPNSRKRVSASSIKSGDMFKSKSRCWSPSRWGNVE